MSTRRGGAAGTSSSYQNQDTSPSEYYSASYTVGSTSSSSQSHYPSGSLHGVHHHSVLATPESELGDSTSDFVKKLFKMLATPAHQDIVHWNPIGDAFIVQDMNGFTTKILPKLFKHSNFASFVRQLNKYDFHKVKSEDGGEGTWTFKHPDFTSNNKSALENIKRKVPASRKSLGNSGVPSSSSASASFHKPDPSEEEPPPLASMSGTPSASVPADIHSLRSEVERLRNEVESMGTRMRKLERHLEESGRCSSNQSTTLASPDSSSLRTTNSPTQPPQLPKLLPPHPPPASTTSSSQPQQLTYAFLPPPETQSLIVPSSTEVVGRESLTWMGEMSMRPGIIPSYAPPLIAPGSSSARQSAKIDEEDDDNEVVMPSSSTSSPANPGNGTGGHQPAGGPTLEVFTFGHLMPSQMNQSQSQDNEIVPASPSTFASSSSERQQGMIVPAQAGGAENSGGGSNKNKLRVRRTTYVPGWSVPPKVLLVDDDEVARKLSTKFLSVFGCTTDVAIDGVSAVNKMNFEKYDLVLMDIVMPKMDGVSATSMIRKFDHRTPIISMTSNSRPDEIVTYYSSGMNDVLPKPFTKQGLYDMVEKHLHHLHLQRVSVQQQQLPPRLPPAGGSGSNPSSPWPLQQQQQQQQQRQEEEFGQGQGQGQGPTYAGYQPTGGNGNGGAGGYVTGWYPPPAPQQQLQHQMINPLGGIGLTDDGYSELLGGMMRGGSGGPGEFFGVGVGGMFFGQKRELESDDRDGYSGGREGKKGRFEVIE